MFVPVACLACGKPFQVAKEKLGQRVPCPWCGQSTDAVPAAVEVNPLPAENQDLTPRPPLHHGEGESASPRGRRRPFLLVAYAVVLLLVAAGVFGWLRYQSGAVPDFALAEFVAPDGSCRAVLPGTAREAPSRPTDELFIDNKWFVSSTWLTPIGGGIGWFDLPPADVKLLREDDLFRTVRDRRAEELGATPDGEGVVRVDSFNGIEVRFVKGSERHVERYLLAKSRVYWVSVGGPNFNPDSPAARRVLASLRINTP